MATKVTITTMTDFNSRSLRSNSFAKFTVFSPILVINAFTPSYGPRVDRLPGSPRLPGATWHAVREADSVMRPVTR